MTAFSQTILIGDDDPAFCSLMELALADAGFAVVIARDGHSLVRLAQERKPDLVLIDLVLPLLDGYEALRQLRNDTRTAHLPLIIISGLDDPLDLVSGFESGADDYVTKPVFSEELLARIRGHLRRAARLPVHSPLTGLAGNLLLVEEIRYRLRRSTPFALIHFDLSGFKAFNDCYGFARGDRAIHLLAEVLRDATMARGGDGFIGHIGGDDFALLCRPEHSEALAAAVVADFAERVGALYDPADLARGYLAANDRDGLPRHFPIMGVNAGGVVHTAGRFGDAEELGQAAAAMRQLAKEQGASGYALDLGPAAPLLLGPPRPL